MGWEPYRRAGWAVIDGSRVRVIAGDRNPDTGLLRVIEVPASQAASSGLPVPTSVWEIHESDFEPEQDRPNSAIDS